MAFVPPWAWQGKLSCQLNMVSNTQLQAGAISQNIAHGLLHLAHTAAACQAT